ncbi:MAG: hypothetical protein LDLANPLL_00940 [Turneriella sp.]|nr:hypothetical protein [Turneriella sp.]
MNPAERKIHWSTAAGADNSYEARVEGQYWQVRIGDFPAEAMYTLFIDGMEVSTFNDWPVLWQKPATPSLPRYYLVNDRPVRFIATPEGGMDVEALNMHTGVFERDLSYLTKVMDPFADVDLVTEAEFEARVAVSRKS